MKSLAEIAKEITVDGNWVQAESDLHQGLQEHPESAKGWYYLAQVEQHLGKVGEARTALSKADSIDPSHAYAGSLDKYNEFVGKLSGQHVAKTVTTTTTTASVRQPSVQPHSDVSVAPYVVGTLVIALVIGLVVWAIKSAQRRQQETDAKVDRAYRDLQEANRASAVESSQRVESNAPNYSRYNSRPTVPPVVQPTVVQPSVVQPVVVQSQPSVIVTGNNGMGYTDALLTGVLLNEALSHDHYRDTYRDNYRDYDAPRSGGFDTGSTTTTTTTTTTFDDADDDFDTGKSSSSSFDTGSSSSSSNWSDSSSSSSFDTGSSFDSGSSGGGDW